jgi:hypothetical protein
MRAKLYGRLHLPSWWATSTGEVNLDRSRVGERFTCAGEIGTIEAAPFSYAPNAVCFHTNRFSSTFLVELRG